MQKSGIKFLRVLPKTIIGLSLALGMTTSTHAANWALGGNYYNAGTAGQACYTDHSDYIVYDCQCNSTVVSHYSTCPGDDGVPECRLEGSSSDGYTRFCWLKNYNICDTCGCTNSTSSWTSTGSGNRVKRTNTTVSDGYYSCTSSSTTEYGCAAGYYKSAGSGSSMTCTKCPSGGTSAIGNSSGIGACYMPAGSTFTDDKGTYTCGGNAYYKS